MPIFKVNRNSSFTFSRDRLWSTHHHQINQDSVDLICGGDILGISDINKLLLVAATLPPFSTLSPVFREGIWSLQMCMCSYNDFPLERLKGIPKTNKRKIENQLLFWPHKRITIMREKNQSPVIWLNYTALFSHFNFNSQAACLHMQTLNSVGNFKVQTPDHKITQILHRLIPWESLWWKIPTLRAKSRTLVDQARPGQGVNWPT